VCGRRGFILFHYLVVADAGEGLSDVRALGRVLHLIVGLRLPAISFAMRISIAAYYQSRWSTSCFFAAQ
jgi:hypothetical protein